MTSMTMESAEPNGQLNAVPNCTCTTLAIIRPSGPPTRNGATKSPMVRQKVKVIPARTPGTESGKVIRRKVRQWPTPRSLEASIRLRGIFSSEV